MDREYIINITVINPKGESSYDWELVGNMSEVLKNHTKADLDKLMFDVTKLIEEYERKEERL